MLGWLAGSCMRFRGLVVVVAAATLVFGIVKLRDEPVDVLPEYGAPTVEVQTEALGLSAAEVEQLITVPMEQDLLNGIAFLKDIRSQSVPGLSRVLLVFEPGTDIYLARQGVAERLAQAHALPQVSKPPQMLQPVSSENRVLMVGISSRTLSAIRMSVLARWTIVPRLLGVPGVANVSIWGQRDRQLQVQVEPERLRDAGVSLNQVLETTGNALWFSPLTFVEASTPGTGGFIDTASQRLGIQHVSPITTADTLAEVPLEGTHGKRIPLQRCRLGRRGPPAAHRRRDRERRRGTHPRDREVPAGERDGRHARSGRGDRLDATRPRRRRLRHDDLPTGVLDRAVDRQPHPGAHSRRRAPRARVCRLLLPVAQRACRPRSRPRVGRLGRARAGGAGQDDERNGACGPRRGARRRHRRRGRRRRQHCTALTRAPGWG